MKTTIFCTLAKMIRNVENKQMSSSHTFYQLDWTIVMNENFAMLGNVPVSQ